MNGSRYKHPTLRRYEKAKAKRDLWDPVLEQAQQFTLPSHSQASQDTKGEDSTKQVFDDTAVNAVQWKKARLHDQLFPPFREWMDLTDQAADDWSDEDKSKHNKENAINRRKFHGAIERSNFHIEIDPALADSLVSTGAIMVYAGTAEMPLRFEAVPITQIVPEEGIDGMIKTFFRPWKIPGRQVEEKWPDAKIPDSAAAGIEKDPEAELEVIEAMLHDHKTDSCNYEVWLIEAAGDSLSGEHKIVTRKYDVSPGIVFRSDKAPGEWMGRGPVLNVLGDVKVANKVVELILKNASINIPGIFLADDDGVMNPATVKLIPGAVIPKAVGSAGLTRLDTAGDTQLAQIILADLQENIRRGIMGPELPPASEGGRTAFEIDVRKTEQQAVELPMSLRLLTELVQQLAKRILHILSSPDMAGSPFFIDEFKVGDKEIKPVPMSPLIKLQDMADAAQSNQTYAAVASMFPEVISGVVNQAAYAKDALEKGNFPAEFLNTEEEQAEFEAMVRMKMTELIAAQRLEQQEQQMVAAE